MSDDDIDNMDFDLPQELISSPTDHFSFTDLAPTAVTTLPQIILDKIQK